MEVLWQVGFVLPNFALALVESVDLVKSCLDCFPKRVLESKKITFLGLVGWLEMHLLKYHAVLQPPQLCSCLEVSIPLTVFGETFVCLTAGHT